MPASTSLSIVRGPEKPELSRLTLGQLADQQEQRYGSKDALVVGWSKARLTFRDLNRRTKELARGLMALGVRKGDRVAIFSGDDERFVELFFAVGRIGAILVILNKTYTIPEFVRSIKVAEPCMVFVSDMVNRKSVVPALERLAAEQFSVENTILLRWDQLPMGFQRKTWDSILQASHLVTDSQLEALEKTVDPNSTVNLQFTSGTTGAPKAAMLSHFNIVNNGFFMGEYLRLTSDDFLCCGPPLFHCFGLVAGLMATFTHGTAIGFAGRDFDVVQVVDMLVNERCTALHGVPTMFHAILEETERRGVEIKTIRKGIAAGTKIPPALHEEVQRRLGYEHVSITYGMTETSPASFMTAYTDTTEQKRESVGTAMPHVTAKVIDPAGQVVPRGVRGEICVSGYLLQQGYFKNPAKTAEVMIPDENGVIWMHTGDEGVIDELGYCRITGRIKDIIIRGGENIYPQEIEERLIEHPDVLGAVVVGVKDRKYGEAVTAFLHPRHGHIKPSLEVLKKWVQDELGRHKAPQHVLWVGEGEAILDYPVTGSGKPRKDVLREIGDKIIHGKTTIGVSKL